MAIADEQDRIIAAAAKAVLTPASPGRQERSRLWISDHGFWAAAVEFQPSSRQRGTYLNVGVSWLWRPKGSWSFDWIEPGRQTPWARFEDAAQFEAATQRLAERAAAEVLELSRRFATLTAVADALRRRAADDRSIWSAYHAGIAAGLVGDVKGARAALAEIAVLARPDVRWTQDLVKIAQALFLRLNDPARFRTAVIGLIGETRAQLKLPVEWPAASVLGADRLHRT